MTASGQSAAVRAVSDGRGRRPWRTAVSPLAHLMPGPRRKRESERRLGAAPASSFAHLIPGFAAASASASRAVGRRRAAALPITTAVPVTSPAPQMSEAERRAYHGARRAEGARWMAVVQALPRADLLPAAVSLMQASYEPAESVIETLEFIAQTTPPAPPPAAAAPGNGRERLEARIAENRARDAAAQAPSDEARALAEHADASEFARYAARTMAKVRNPNGRPAALLPRTPR